LFLFFFLYAFYYKEILNSQFRSEVHQYQLDTRNNKPHCIKHMHHIIYDNWFLYACSLVRPNISSFVRNSATHATTTFSCYDVKKQNSPKFEPPTPTTVHVSNLIHYSPSFNPLQPSTLTPKSKQFKNRTIGP